MKLLKDKLALVTGSSRGLGAAIAAGMAAHGAKLILTDVDVIGAEELARDLTAK
ncbi:MAG: short chain dehydrogenase, partial [Pseudomonadota bacterium]